LRRKVIFLTGQPGVGKTTVLLKTIEELKKRGLTVGGMISKEVRENGSRIGFRITDLKNGREGWLAHVRQPTGPKIGRYTVCLSELDAIGVKAVLNAIKTADVVAIDEVGPMELFSSAFRNAVVKALNSNKTVLGVIHRRARHPLVDAIKKRGDVKIVEVTRTNRGILPRLVAEKIYTDVAND